MSQKVDKVNKAALRKKIKAQRAKEKKKEEKVLGLLTANIYLQSKRIKVYEIGGKEAFARKNAPKERMTFKEWEEFFKKY